jgi:signal transduction histidine kinase
LGQRFPAVGSVSGDVLRSGQTIVLEDASQDARVAQPQVRAGHIGPSVFEALKVDGRPFGTLAVSRTRGAAPFTPDELALVATLAAHAGVVVGYEEARQQRSRFALLEDQERIARNLHDTVIQRLFAVGLSLQGATGFGGDGTAGRRVSDVIRELDLVIDTIRTVIFDVQTAHTDSRTPLRRQVLDLCHEMAAALRVEPGIVFIGPVDSSTPAPIADELVPTLREALSNIARHARATQVHIEVKADSALLTLSVRDNGIGLRSGAGTEPRGLGIGNMRARAELLGGDFTIGPAPGGGTELIWQVPCVT